MTTLANYSALRNYAYTSGNETVFVEGYSAVSDGGEGLFYWGGASTGLADNDGTILASTSSTPGVWIRPDADILNVKWFGAAGGVAVTQIGQGVSITIGTTALTTSSNFFLSSDVGKTLRVVGAGPLSSYLTATITAYSSATAVTLSTPAGTTALGTVLVVLRSDDTAAIQAAITYANTTRTAKNVFIPAGNYLVSNIIIPFGMTVFGENGSNEVGISGSCLWQMPGSNTSLIKVTGNLVSFTKRNFWWGTIRDLSLQGCASNTAGYGISLRSDFSGRTGGTSTDANTPTALQDTAILENLSIAYFKDGGIEMPDGGDPGYLQNIKLQRNGGPGITIAQNANLHDSSVKSSAQSMSFINISGDANIGGLILIDGYTSTINADTFVFVNLKGEDGTGNPYTLTRLPSVGPISSDAGTKTLTIATTSLFSSVNRGQFIKVTDTGSSDYLSGIIEEVNSPMSVKLSIASTKSFGNADVVLSGVEQQNFIVLKNGCTAMISIHGACNQPTVSDSNNTYSAVGDLILLEDSSNPILFWNGANLKYVSGQYLLPPSSTIPGKAPNIFNNTSTGATAPYNQSFGATNWPAIQLGNIGTYSPAALPFPGDTTVDLDKITTSVAAFIQSGASNAPQAPSAGSGNVLSLGYKTTAGDVFSNQLYLRTGADEMYFRRKSTPPPTGSDANGFLPWRRVVFNDGILLGDGTQNLAVTNAMQMVKLASPTGSNWGITLPAASYNSGLKITVWNQSTSSTLHWIWSPAIYDATGSSITTLANTTVYQLESDGTNWIKVN